MLIALTTMPETEGPSALQRCRRWIAILLLVSSAVAMTSNLFVPALVASASSDDEAPTVAMLLNLHVPAVVAVALDTSKPLSARPARERPCDDVSASSTAVREEASHRCTAWSGRARCATLSAESSAQLIDAMETAEVRSGGLAVARWFGTAWLNELGVGQTLAEYKQFLPPGEEWGEGYTIALLDTAFAEGPMPTKEWVRRPARFASGSVPCGDPHDWSSCNLGRDVVNCTRRGERFYEWIEPKTGGISTGLNAWSALYWSTAARTSASMSNTNTSRSGDADGPDQPAPGPCRIACSFDAIASLTWRAETLQLIDLEPRRWRFGHGAAMMRIFTAVLPAVRIAPIRVAANDQWPGGHQVHSRYTYHHKEDRPLLFDAYARGIEAGLEWVGTMRKELNIVAAVISIVDGKGNAPGEGYAMLKTPSLGVRIAASVRTLRADGVAVHVPAGNNPRAEGGGVDWMASSTSATIAAIFNAKLRYTSNKTAEALDESGIQVVRDEEGRFKTASTREMSTRHPAFANYAQGRGGGRGGGGPSRFLRVPCTGSACATSMANGILAAIVIAMRHLVHAVQYDWRALHPSAPGCAEHEQHAMNSSDLQTTKRYPATRLGCIETLSDALIEILHATGHASAFSDSGSGENFTVVDVKRAFRAIARGSSLEAVRRHALK